LIYTLEVEKYISPFKKMHNVKGKARKKLRETFT